MLEDGVDLDDLFLCCREATTGPAGRTLPGSPGRIHSGVVSSARVQTVVPREETGQP